MEQGAQTKEFKGNERGKCAAQRLLVFCTAYCSYPSLSAVALLLHDEAYAFGAWVVTILCLFGEQAALLREMKLISAGNKIWMPAEMLGAGVRLSRQLNGSLCVYPQYDMNELIAVAFCIACLLGQHKHRAFCLR